MAHRFEKGKHIYFLFRGGYTVQDSQLKPRYYLDRKKAEEYLPYGDEIVEYAPTLTLDDIIPHGRWIDTVDYDAYWDEIKLPKCNLCGNVAYGESNYCPNCGAKMDKEETE